MLWAWGLVAPNSLGDDHEQQHHSFRIFHFAAVRRARVACRERSRGGRKERRRHLYPRLERAVRRQSARPADPGTGRPLFHHPRARDAGESRRGCARQGDCRGKQGDRRRQYRAFRQVHGGRESQNHYIQRRGQHIPELGRHHVQEGIQGFRGSPNLYQQCTIGRR